VKKEERKEPEAESKESLPGKSLQKKQILGKGEWKMKKTQLKNFEDTMKREWVF